MHKKFVALAILWLGLLTFSAYAENATVRVDITSPQHAAHHGALYRVRYQGNTAWLFGTIHVGSEQIDPLEGEAGATLAAADRLVVEVNIEDSAEMQRSLVKYALYPPGDGIDQHLSKRTLARLRTAAENAGIPYELLTPMKPCFAADLLMLNTLEKQGYSAQQGTDLSLMHFARSHGKPIGELESADFQFGLFDSLTAKQQEQYLVEQIDEIESGETARETKKLFDAWVHSDTAAFNTLLKEMNEDKRLSAQLMKRRFMDARNPAMAKKIATMLKTEKNVFIGVGLMHLLGKEGLPELLKREGYEVERIY